jgi:hypothetical protein
MAEASSVYDAVPLQHGASTNIRVIEILDEAGPQGLICCYFHTISLRNKTGDAIVHSTVIYLG